MIPPSYAARRARTASLTAAHSPRVKATPLRTGATTAGTHHRAIAPRRRRVCSSERLIRPGSDDAMEAKERTSETRLSARGLRTPPFELRRQAYPAHGIRTYFAIDGRSR